MLLIALLHGQKKQVALAFNSKGLVLNQTAARLSGISQARLEALGVCCRLPAIGPVRIRAHQCHPFWDMRASTHSNPPTVRLRPRGWIDSTINWLMGFHAVRVGAKILRDRFNWVPEAPVVAILAASGSSGCFSEASI
ncbi:hypothetical protein B0H14DRAFT_2617250 [Mycena olivaceomarginata]|nr:hypothetical protein B0H14DRAFT_2617250 [Mycena olivaceomarginata]